jgi:hypothetical protein
LSKYVGKKIVKIEARRRNDGEFTCVLLSFEDGTRLNLYGSFSGDTLVVAEERD